MSATQSSPIDLSATDPRVQKGCVIAAGSGQWLRGHTAAGEIVYGIPSSRRGVYYRVTLNTCECPDAKRFPDGVCKHRYAAHISELSAAYRKMAAHWFADEPEAR